MTRHKFTDGKTLFSAPLLVSIVLTTVLWKTSADASSPDADTSACHALAGTYVTTVTDVEGVFASRGLVTFTPVGVFLMSDSGQSGLPGIYEPFTSAQGAWKCQGAEGDQVKATALGLNFALPSAGHSAGFGRTRYQLTLDTKSGHISGTAELSFTAEGDLESADPVSKPGPVFETFEIEGKRVTLE